MEKIEQWSHTAFEKRRNSNGGTLQRSKNGETQTVELSSVRKKRKLEQWRPPAFEKRRNSNGGTLPRSKNGETRTVELSSVRKTEKLEQWSHTAFEKRRNSNGGPTDSLSDIQTPLTNIKVVVTYNLPKTI
jgi:hypothetical protein